MCRAFAEPGGHSGTREDTIARQIAGLRHSLHVLLYSGNNGTREARVDVKTVSELVGGPEFEVPGRTPSNAKNLDNSLTRCQNTDILQQTVAIRTAAGEAATRVILAIFRLNGLLLAAGDLLAAEYGLTSARWQVLGAIALAQRPLTVPQIARRMGLTRQTVHTTVDRLLADGMVVLVPNSDHLRSQLVSLTDRGRAGYQAIDEKQAAWVNGLSAGVRRSDLDMTARVLDQLCTRLEAGASQVSNRAADR